MIVTRSKPVSARSWRVAARRASRRASSPVEPGDHSAHRADRRRRRRGSTARLGLEHDGRRPRDGPRRRNDRRRRSSGTPNSALDRRRRRAARRGGCEARGSRRSTSRPSRLADQFARIAAEEIADVGEARRTSQSGESATRKPIGWICAGSAGHRSCTSPRRDAWITDKAIAGPRIRRRLGRAGRTRVENRVDAAASDSRGRTAPRARSSTGVAVTSGSALSRSSSDSCAVRFPHLHRVALDQRIAVLAAEAGLGQREQHALRMDEAAHAVEVLLHPLGIDEQLVDHAGQPGEREVERDAVASGPMKRSTEECEMSRSCHSATFSIAGTTARADDAGEAGEILGQHRVALVRHRRAALLARARNIPRPRALRCAAGGGFRSPAARSTRRSRPASRRTSRGGRAG